MEDFCDCGTPWVDPKKNCLQCGLVIDTKRFLKPILVTKDYCDCGIPEFGIGNVCEKCDTEVSHERMLKLGRKPQPESSITNVDSQTNTGEERESITKPELISVTERSYCTNCGKLTEPSHSYCSYCGNLINSGIATNPHNERVSRKPSAVPEEIRINLKNYKSHIELTCLECGYVGLMGVSKVIEHKKSSWPIWVLGGFMMIFGTFGFGFIGTLVVGGLLGAYMGLKENEARETFVMCPSCSTELKINK